MSESCITNAGSAFAKKLKARSTIEFRKNESVIPFDLWKKIDKKIVSVSAEELYGVQDLIDYNLVDSDLTIGDTLYTYTKRSELTKAEIDMLPQTQTQKDRVVYDEDGVPIPIIHKDMEITMRESSIYENGNIDINMKNLGEVVRSVSYTMEDALFNGVPGLKVKGYEVKGYTNAEHRIPVDLDYTVNTLQGLSQNINKMLGELFAKKQYGPYMIYVPTEVWTKLSNDYINTGSTGSGTTAIVSTATTILERIKKYPKIIDIKHSPMLATGNIAIINFKSSTIELLDAQSITATEWEENQFVKTLKVWGSLTPLIQSDLKDQCGVCIGTHA